jgi:hypothetical protein
MTKRRKSISVLLRLVMNIRLTPLPCYSTDKHEVPMERIENTGLKKILADSSSYTDEDWKKYLSTAVQ